MDWRHLSAAELEREYSPSSMLGGHYQPFIDQYIIRSAAARAECFLQWPQLTRWHVPYGTASTQTFDLFLPAPSLHRDAKPALLVFIHGGYWQELSKNESQFAAIECVQQGWAHAVLDYTLAPHASVAGIVAECKQALGYLIAHADTLGFDAQRIVVAGSSAGAHLAAMVALGGITQPDGKVCKNALRGVVLVSGVFDLRPLLSTSINAALGLDTEQASRMSPALASAQDLTAFPPYCLVWGEIETTQFKQQSRAFAQLLAQHGAAPKLLEVPQRNHFDVVLELCTPNTALGAAVADLLDQG